MDYIFKSILLFAKSDLPILRNEPFNILKNIKHTIFISSTFLFTFFSSTISEETQKVLPYSKPQNVLKLIIPSAIPNRLKSAKIVTILINSPNSLFGYLIQDLFSMKLMDKGYTVILPDSISAVMATKVDTIRQKISQQQSVSRQKMLTIIQQSENSSSPDHALNLIKAQLNLEQQKEKEQLARYENRLTLKSISEKLGIKAAFICTVFEGRRQINIPNKKNKAPSFEDKMVISLFYMELLDIKQNKPVLSLLIECDKGENVANIVDNAINTIINELNK